MVSSLANVMDIHHGLPPLHTLSLPPANIPAESPAGGKSQEETDRARAYKSRNKRPCDFCRYKKAACHLNSQPPCELCIRYKKTCTFLESPAKRRRPNNDNADGERRKSSATADLGSNGSGRNAHTPFMNGGAIGGDLNMSHDFGWDSGIPSFDMPGIGMTPGSGLPDFGAFDPTLYNDPNMGFGEFEPMSATTSTFENRKDSGQQHLQSSVGTSPHSQSTPMRTDLQLPFDSTSGEPSLDKQDSCNAQSIGISGENDPWLLSRYRFDEYNEASFQSIRLRKLRDGSVDEGRIPTFFTIAHNALTVKAQPVAKSETIDKLRQEMEDMVSDDVGKRLIHLYYKYVQPYFPILTREDGLPRDESGVREPKYVPTCVLAATYGHALPFCSWDEKLCVEVYTPPSADSMFRIAWLTVQPLLHTPTLAVLKTLLLLVQRKPTNKHVADTPFKWLISNLAVGVAQTLGINRDPSDWALPSWEIKLRKRLAWATFIQDKWLALNFGRSSHIHPDAWDVEHLTMDDFSDAHFPADSTQGQAEVYGQHFMRLCELTLIVDEIMHELFSLRATRKLHGRLEATLEVAKPLRLQLTEWYQSLPPGLIPQTGHGSPDSDRKRSFQHELDGHGSLYLAYITAKIELFRAMLRPRVTDANAAAVTALRTGAFTVAKEIYEFLDGLNAHQLEAFWASCELKSLTSAHRHRHADGCQTHAQTSQSPPASCSSSS